LCEECIYETRGNLICHTCDEENTEGTKEDGWWFCSVCVPVSAQKKESKKRQGSEVSSKKGKKAKAGL
jgi:hypothetical protein